VASVQLTNLTSSLPTTTVFTPTSDGLFRLSIYAVFIGPYQAGQEVEMVWNYTDDNGPEQYEGGFGASPLPLTTLIRAKANTPLRYFHD
jgi:hypothetical protein